MGRAGCYARFSVFHNQQVAITDTGMQGAAVTVQLAFKNGNKAVRFFGRYVSGAVIIHGGRSVLRKTDQVAAEGDISGSQRNPHADGFDRRAAGVVLFRVIAQNAHIGNIAARFKTFGNRADHAKCAAGCKMIHAGGAADTERGFVAVFLKGAVGHAVAKQDNVFHYGLTVCLMLI